MSTAVYPLFCFYPEDFAYNHVWLNLWRELSTPRSAQLKRVTGETGRRSAEHTDASTPAAAGTVRAPVSDLT